MECKRDMVMVAEHDGKVYVASESLDRRLRRTERLLYAVALMLGLVALAIVAAVLIKWDLVLSILLGML